VSHRIPDHLRGWLLVVDGRVKDHCHECQHVILGHDIMTATDFVVFGDGA
jgi:hypothetical protein